MSVGDEPVECPLCMEPLEIDDVNFFPCTCGYQICRFCWHRIRTDENGLCPACRKQYPEDPAEFKPLTDDELSRIKKERRQKDLQRKQKAAENRKHLANVRVVQRNLVFVVGLSQRLAESDVLKKHEYFGKFGKIHKVVINQSTSYAGVQSHVSRGPSASAYVTYTRSEDALRAILAVNNVHIDGRTLKASLGTTKYCSHFLRGSQCQKSDCMYLHELGEEAASFTKEEMQMGKHQEYEQKLLEQFLNSQNTANNHTTTNNNKKSRKKSSSPVNEQENAPKPTPPEPPAEKPAKAQPIQPPAQSTSEHPPATCKENWPSLQPGGKIEKQLTNGTRTATHNTISHTHRSNTPPEHCKAVGNGRKRHSEKTDTHLNSHPPDRPQELTDLPTEREAAPPVVTQNNASTVPSRPQCSLPAQSPSTQAPFPVPHSQSTPPPPQSQPVAPIGSNRKPVMFEQSANSLSYFGGSGSSYPCNNKMVKPPVMPQNTPDVPVTLPPPGLSDTLPTSSSAEWQNTYTYRNNKDIQDDDLGFDPCDESFKGLADLIEKENGLSQGLVSNHYTSNMQQSHTAVSAGRPLGLHGGDMPPVHPAQAPRSLPPGFSLSHIQQQQQQLQQQQHFQHRQQQQQIPFFRPDMTSHKMMDFLPGYSQQNFSHLQQQQQQHPVPPPPQQQQQPNSSQFHNSLPDRQLPGRVLDHTQMPPHQQPPQSDVFKMEDMQNQLRSLLPNINISFGSQPQHTQHTQRQTQAASLANSHKSNAAESAPHWLKSIHQLTEGDAPGPNHRLPFAQQFPFSASTMWPPQTHNPPPGFQLPMRNTAQIPEPHKISEGL